MKEVLVGIALLGFLIGAGLMFMKHVGPSIVVTLLTGAYFFVIDATFLQPANPDNHAQIQRALEDSLYFWGLLLLAARVPSWLRSESPDAETQAFKKLD